MLPEILQVVSVRAGVPTQGGWLCSLFQPPCHAASSSPARGDTLVSTAINFHLSSQMLEICFVSWRSPYLLEFLEAVLLLDSDVILLILGEMMASSLS